METSQRQWLAHHHHHHQKSSPWRQCLFPARVPNGLSRTPCGLGESNTRRLAMKPHEAHAKTGEAQGMTSTTRGARPGVGNRGLSWQGYDLNITSGLSHDHSWEWATGLICIDTKALLSIHRLIQMFCCHRRWGNHRVGVLVARQGSLRTLFSKNGSRGPFPNELIRLEV